MPTTQGLYLYEYPQSNNYNDAYASDMYLFQRVSDMDIPKSDQQTKNDIFP